MLTIFSTPKPFDGHIGTIQRNAIRSWTLLRPRPQIILFGKDRGAAETAAELGIVHVRDVRVSKFGTPLLSDMFAQAQQMAEHELICHVNADIILMGSLYQAVELLREQCGKVLMFCSPWLLPVEQEIVGSPDWEAQLHQRVKTSGQPPKLMGVDTFLFPRGFFDQMPPFAVGRTAQDNWLLHRACHAPFPAVDGSRFVLSVHQAHAGSTHYGNYEINAEVQRNRRLAGWWARSFVAEDLPYVLTEDGQLLRKGVVERLRPRLRAVYSPVAIHLLNLTYTVRHKMGLYRR